MSTHSRRAAIVIIAVLISLWARTAFALIMGGFGNDPVNDGGWPLGAVDVANLKTRVGWWEGPPFGGGQYQYLYRGNADDFNAALKTFAKVRAPVLELIVLDGPFESFWLKTAARDGQKVDPRVDWTFTVWTPANWHRLYNNPKSVLAADQPQFRRPVDPPRVELYVGGGQVQWEMVKVPEGVRVIDSRAAASGVKPAAGGGATVRGGVYDMATGKPVSRARVSVRKRGGNNEWDEIVTAQSDAVGAFDLRNVPPGEGYSVTVSAEEYAPRLIGYESLTANAFRTFDNIELIKAAKLSGTVTDASGKPIKGAKVRPTPLAIDGRGYASPDRIEAKSDPDGRFTLAGLPQGYAELWCTADEYFQPEAVGKLYDVPSEGVKLVLVGTGKVRVVVVGLDGKPPTGDVNVNIGPEGDPIGKWGAGANLPANGIYEVGGVPPGKYWVSTQFYPGHAEQNPAAKPVVVEAGKTAEVKLVHSAGGRAKRAGSIN